MSKIQWTERTWNPLAGCTEVSPGCKNCYAAVMAHRLAAMGQEKYQGTTRKLANGKVVWTGKISLMGDDTLGEPLRRKKPTMYFVNSMSDLFHEDVPDHFVAKVFAVMLLSPQHTFQILTKRPERMAEVCDGEHFHQDVHEAVKFRMGYDHPERPAVNRCDLPLKNVWLGTSVEDQKHSSRLHDLLCLSAAVHFASVEPLLGPLDLTRCWDAAGRHRLNALTGGFDTPDRAPFASLDWVIVGGESGPGARPLNVAWVRSIVKQCKQAGVACFVKQLGAAPVMPSLECPDCFGDGEEKIPCGPDDDRCEFCDGTGYHKGEYPGPMRLKDRKGGTMEEWPEDLRIRQFPEVGR